MDMANRLWRAIGSRIPNSEAVPLVRLILGASTFLLIPADRRAAYEFSPAAGALLAYLSYASIQYWLIRARVPFVRRIARWEHWVDVSVYTFLVMLHGEKGPYFLCPLFLVIVVASWRRGPAPALALTLASILAIAASLLISQIRSGIWDLQSALISPLALLALGGIIIHWDRSDVLLKRRLEFISGVTKISSPRQGAACVIRAFMEQLRAFYDADSCILVMPDPGETELTMTRVDRSPARGRQHSVRLSADHVRPFTGLPPEAAVVRRGRRHSRFRHQPGYFEYNTRLGKPAAESREQSEKLAAILDTPCFLTVPLCFRNETVGRIFLTSSRIGFQESDIHFLLQVFDHFMPLMDNIRLADRMVTDVCLAERKKIARDLHDTILQPYIGMKLGIGSLRQKLEEGTLDARDIERLIRVHEQAISDVRRYLLLLRGQVEQDGDLLLSIRRFVEKFTFATGIVVDMDAGDLSQVDGSLAAEALQMIAEGLSNIRRHTNSMKARIYVHCLDGQLAISIEDCGDSGGVCKSFRPWSISERAEALGGRAAVEIMSHGGSRVLVDVPL